jgi:hypothetical protein
MPTGSPAKNPTCVSKAKDPAHRLLAAPRRPLPPCQNGPSLCVSPPSLSLSSLQRSSSRSFLARSATSSPSVCLPYFAGSTSRRAVRAGVLVANSNPSFPALVAATVGLSEFALLRAEFPFVEKGARAEVRAIVKEGIALDAARLRKRPKLPGCASSFESCPEVNSESSLSLECSSLMRSTRVRANLSRDSACWTRLPPPLPPPISVPRPRRCATGSWTQNL